MKSLPDRTFTIRTPLSKEQAIAELELSVEPLKFRLMPNKGGKAFEGEIRDDAFIIRRRISYRNSFLPVIEGKVMAEGGGSAILIRMRLHRIILVFSSIWISFVVLFLFIGLAHLVASGSFEFVSVAIFFLMFYSILHSACFYPEVAYAKKLLLEIFRGTEPGL